MVSVVIPTHNRALLLHRAVVSVLKQDYENFEIVIVDDASQDETQEVVASLQDSRIRYMRQEVNGGVSAARNRGIKESQGTFLAFLDDDDTWLPGKISQQVERMANPHTGMVYCGALLVDETGVVRAKSLVQKRGYAYETLLFKNIIVSPSAVMVRRKCFDDAGLFDVSLHGTADFDMWIRLSRMSLIDCVPEYLIRYTAFQRNSLGSTKRMLDEYPQLYNKFLTYPYRSDALRRKVLAYRLYEQGNAYAFIGDRVNARRAYIRSLRKWPLNLKAWFGMGAVVGGARTWRLLESAKRRFNRATKPL